MKIADMHCDTISEIWESQRTGKPQQLFQNSLHVDIQKMKKANYILQNFALYIDMKKDLTHLHTYWNWLMSFRMRYKRMRKRFSL